MKPEIRLYRDDEFPNKGTPLARLKENPNSRRLAIEAFCFQCMYSGGNGDGGWRQQVNDCTTDKCALWRVRPQTKEVPDV